MFSFKLSAVERAVREDFRSFASRFLRPYAEEADRAADIPKELLGHPEVLNCMRFFIPREFGGGCDGITSSSLEYDLADSALLRALMCEEIGYGDASLFVALPGIGLAEPVLRAYGSEAQQKRLFAPFLGTEPKWAAFAMTEPRGGSDVVGITTTARREKDRYVLNGKKWLIGNGARANWVVVFATVNPQQGQFGLRSIVVERGTPGFSVGRILPTMGMRALQVAELIFEDCYVSEANLLSRDKNHGKAGGFQSGMRTFYLMRPGVAAMAIGTGRAAVELVEEIVRQNGARHVLAHRWAAMRRRLESVRTGLQAARLLCWNAAWLYDQGRNNIQEASMAKALSASACLEACAASMEIAANAGLRDMKTLDRLFRNAKAFNIVEGTGEIQKATVASMLLRKDGRVQESLDNDSTSKKGMGESQASPMGSALPRHSDSLA